MAKTNFQYEKRQRELEKKMKSEEKARKKLEAKNNPGGEGEGAPEEDDGEEANSESQDPA